MRSGQAAPHLRIAAVQAATGDGRSAISRLQGVIRTDPRNIQARAMLGEVYLGMKRTEEAWEVAHALKKIAPNSSSAHRLEGDILLATGESPLVAVAAYERADRIHPSGDLRIRTHRSKALSGRGTVPIQPLQDWLATNPNDTEVKMYLAAVLLDAGKHREAADHYSEVAAQYPDDHRVLNNLAWAKHLAKDSGALAIAERAVKLAPSNPHVLDTYGSILLAEGRVSEAAQTLLAAVSKALENPELRLHLAQALVKVGDLGRARKELLALRQSDGTRALSGLIETLLATTEK